MQANSGINITEEGNPFSYDLHNGSIADENTVLGNMRELQNLRANLAESCKDPPLITGKLVAITTTAVFI